MSMTRFIILFLLLISLSSCEALKLSERDVIGRYKFSRDYIGATLVLNEDNTFEYILFMDVGGLCEPTGGEWYLNKGKLVMKSYPEVKNGYIIVKEAITDNPHIELSNEEDFVWDYIKDVNEYLYTDKDGEVYLDCHLNVAFVNSSTYKVQNKKSNTFYVKVIFRDNCKIYFDDSFKITKSYAKIGEIKYNKLKGD